MLEYSLIKQHRPRFNIRLKDDKSYPFLAVTLDDEWPRAMVMRGTKRKGVRYFGPYAHAYAIRETLDLLLRTFPIRTCSDNKLGRHQRLGRPCLLFHIEKCSGPCVGEIAEPTTTRWSHDLVDFLDGDTDPVVHRLEAEMHAAADELEFERAARVRDRLASVRKAIEKQQMVVEKPEDLDVIGLPTTSSRRRCRCSSCAAAGSSAARASSSTRSRTSPRASSSTASSSTSTATRRRSGVPEGGARPGRAGRPRRSTRSGSPTSGARRSPSASRSGATSAS